LTIKSSIVRGLSSFINSEFIICKENHYVTRINQVQTIIREISADLETPVSLYLKLRGDGASFLLESVEGGERIARYSFIGVQPRRGIYSCATEIEVKENTVHAPSNSIKATRPSFCKMKWIASPLSACRTRRASRVGWWAFSGSSRFGFLNQLSARK
jgi:anthranilate/para-aminobenzoate synthase component I